MTIPKKLLPTRKQLSNYIYRCKKTYIEQNMTGTIADFLEFKAKNSWSTELEGEKMFVVYLNTAVDNFIMILSSKALLTNLIDQPEKSKQPSFFNIDATYKLIVDGFLVLTLCTEDPKHRGRVVALGITLHEDFEAYKTFILEIRRFLEIQMQYLWSPTFCMSDGADSIHKAVKTVFPWCKQLLCYFHVKKAVKRHISTTKNLEVKKKLKANQGLIMYGLKLLHKTPSAERFDQLWKLLSAKLMTEHEVPLKFIEYMNTEYISTPKYWNVGSAFVGNN